MTDEQKRAMALLIGIGLRPTAHQAFVVADFLVDRERRALLLAADIAKEEAGEYAASAKKLDADKRHDAATQEIHGELACKRIEERIRLLVPSKQEPPKA